jgi:hypothetical protein
MILECHLVKLKDAYPKKLQYQENHYMQPQDSLETYKFKAVQKLKQASM